MSKNSKKYVLVLDLGKGVAKSLGCEITDSTPNPESLKKYMFETKSYDLNKGYTELQGNSYKIDFNGSSVILGEQGIDRSFETSKTTPLHQMCAYTLISQYLEPDTKDNEIYLVLACPITVLKSDKAKQEYKNLIKGNGPISITVNDRNYEFEIKDILIKAESSGVLYLMPEEFKDKKILVVDFGGLNMTNTIFTNGVCVNPDNDRFAEEWGSVELINKVSKYLTDYSKGNIVDFQTSEEALNRGHLLEYGKPDLASTEYIERAKQEFIDDSLKKLARHNVRTKNLDATIYIGGTSSYLKEQIKALPNGQITDNPQWSSVEGLLKIAIKKYIK